MITTRAPDGANNMDLRDASASKNYVADFCHYRRYFGHEFQKKLQHNFPKMSGGAVKGRLELFRKFIRFGRGRRPLIQAFLHLPVHIPQVFLRLIIQYLTSNVAGVKIGPTSLITNDNMASP